VLKFNLIGKFAISCLIFFCGLVIYATYAGCDPMTLGKIKKKDEIITYYVMDKLSFNPRPSWIICCSNNWSSLEHLVFVYQLLRGSVVERRLLKIRYFQKYFTVLCDVDQQNTITCCRNCYHWISHNCVI
ncbi:hypothetical protein Avbf_05256, partial [Armadillidium vulgare]